MGFLFPTAHEGSKVHLTRAYRPATFRLQGLVTLLTAFSLRSRAGSLSHRQRSWDSPFGGPPPGRYPVCYHPEAPTYRWPWRYSRRRSAGPAQQGPVSGLCPFRKFQATEWGFSPSTTGASLGFRSSRALSRRPWTGFRPSSSHALHSRSDESPRPPAPQSLDQPSPDSFRQPAPKRKCPEEAALLEFLHRSGPEHSSESPIGLMGSPHASPRIAAGRQTI
jgi:hypothetical protein